MRSAPRNKNTPPPKRVFPGFPALLQRGHLNRRLFQGDFLAHFQP